MSQVARVEQKQELASVPMEGATLLSVISRAAADPGTDVEKMERLMQMYERIESKRAETAFNEALNDAQSKIGRISGDKYNKQTSSNYATYAKLDTRIRPIYIECGFSLSFDTQESASPDCIKVVCYVSHKGGHTRSYHVDMPADGKGAKGGDVMTKTHAAGSAMSYGMRYLLKMIFNVAIGEHDDDGNMASAPIDDGATEQMVTDWLSAIGGAITLDELKKLSGDIAAQKMPQHSRDVIRSAYNARKEVFGRVEK